MTQDDVRITEMINGVLVTRPVKKFQEITNETPVTTSEPKVIDLQEYALNPDLKQVLFLTKVSIR